MKCPKCGYLGFDTGERCKNCGYDFSLMVDGSPEPADIDLDFARLGAEPAEPAESADWLAKVDGSLSPPPPRPAAPIVRDEPTLPLFTKLDEPVSKPVVAFDDDSDEPLIKLPPAPRPPLAVRRTPDTPRLRAIQKSVRRIEPEAVLEFEDGAASPDPRMNTGAALPVSRVWSSPRPAPRRPASAPAEASHAGARLAALGIDHLILCGIDAGVVYFTLRMAGLAMGEWAALPALPLLVFLLLLKLSYFCAFTAVGGQTIGKMAARIRVVSTDDEPIDAALALRRTLAGVVSAALLGLGFLPALYGTERRALHDRVAHTRVVALPSA